MPALPVTAPRLPSSLSPSSDASFLRLAPGVFPKWLEEPHLYDSRSDELYELSGEAYSLLLRCDGTQTAGELRPESEFLASCLGDGLLELSREPKPVRLPPSLAAPVPSLRYLELQLTSRCNLACAHCCLGPASSDDLPLEQALSALRQLEAAQGLRVLLTGGEPLLHPGFWELNERLPDHALRFVLLTNGTLLTPEAARRLRVHEVQVSLDGLEPGHDVLRGAGSYRRARQGLLVARDAGLAVSVATMVHRGNTGDFAAMARDLEALGVREWGIDVPCRAGRWAGQADLEVSPAEAAHCLAFAFGGSYHGEGSGEGCGSHLATVTPRGEVLRCGFFPDEPLGTLEEGLETAWARRRPWDLSGSACAGCEALAECGGGCRYRAGGASAPDPVMCAAFGRR